MIGRNNIDANVKASQKLSDLDIAHNAPFLVSLPKSHRTATNRTDLRVDGYPDCSHSAHLAQRCSQPRRADQVEGQFV